MLEALSKFDPASEVSRSKVRYFLRHLRDTTNDLFKTFYGAKKNRTAILKLKGDETEPKRQTRKKLSKIVHFLLQEDI